MAPQRRASDRIFGLDKQQMLGFIATALSAVAGVIWTVRIGIAQLETANKEAATRREMVMEGLHRELDTQNARIAALEARRCNDR